jgi:hypothetical protein
LEGARRLFLECEQIYVKLLGADHGETLDAAMRAMTVGEEEEEEQGEEGDSDQGEEEDQAGIAEKDYNTVEDSTQSINRAQHDNAPLFQLLTCTTSRYYLMPRI